MIVVKIAATKITTRSLILWNFFTLLAYACQLCICYVTGLGDQILYSEHWLLKCSRNIGLSFLVECWRVFASAGSTPTWWGTLKSCSRKIINMYLKVSCYYWQWSSVLGDLIIPADSLTASLVWVLGLVVLLCLWVD